MNPEQGIQLDDLRGILRRRGRTFFAVVGATFLLAIFLASVLPDEYQSQATLLIEPQTISEKLVESNLSETDLNNRLHLISMQILSRGRLSKIIDELGVHAELEDEMTRAEIIEYMHSRISVAPVMSSLEASAGIRRADAEINTFQLSYRHRNPAVAAAVTNRLANNFVEEHIKNRAEMSGDTSEFIEAELQRLSARIADVEQRIATIKTLNVGRLPEDLNVNQNAYERLIENIRETQRELAIAQSDEAFYGQQILAGAGGGGIGGVETPEKRLEALKIFLTEAKARGLTDKHPEVIRFHQEIEELEREMASAKENASREEATLSLFQENARAEQQRASLRAEAARMELERLQERATELEARMGETPRVAEQLAALEREHQHLFQSFQQYSAKRLEAGVAADMERRQKGERFRVLEAAVASPQPASPNRPVILALGLVMGVMAGSGLALLSEVTDRSFHDPRSLQSRLGIPVLAAVPPVMLESDRALERARFLRRAFGAAMVACVVIVASLAGNWMVNGLPGPLAGLIGRDAGRAAPAPEPAPAPAQGGR